MLGIEVLREPRLWSEYGPDYYAVFIRDPAGNNLEFKCRASPGTVTRARRTQVGDDVWSWLAAHE